MNIVILGGGTSGWLTALYAKKIYNNEKIILVESEEYGILGAGEGTTPNFIDFLNFLEIPITELIKHCKSTIKNGIKFTNWSKEGDSYFHPFVSKSLASNDYNFILNNSFLEKNTSFSHFCASIKNNKLKDYSFVEKISNELKVPYVLDKKNNALDNFANIAIHFDAKLLANYLKLIGKNRGIVVKEGIVNKIVCNSDGYISQLQTNNEKIDCDFVFDCSGFKRVIIGNYYKAKWKSHSNHLPAKKAIPFFLKMDEKIPPYTESIAMNFGWMWKIPLQHRYGCGYVFDSNYISDQDAIKEIENYLGFEPEYPRKDKGSFNFVAGCFEDVWIKNCLAVGLSSGFIEPLEATSIMQQILVLQNFMSNKQNIVIKNELIKKRFNEIYLKQTQEVVDFLYLHYITNKKNTSFWKNFVKNNEIPKNIKYILNICNDKPLNNEIDLYNNTIFNLSSYYYVLLGNKILKIKKIKEQSVFLLNNEKINNYKNILKEQKILIPKLLTHNNFIDIILKGENIV